MTRQKIIRKRKYIRKHTHNKTYCKKHTKREYSKKMRQIKILFCAFFLIGIYQYFTITTNKLTITNSNGDVVDTQVEDRVKAVSFVATPVAETTSNEISAAREHSVEEQIRELAVANNFNSTAYNTQSPDYLVNLACCEGLMNPETENKLGNTPAWSIDRGLYGINNHWHKEVSDECAKDIKCSTEWTIQRLKDGYYYEWMCHRKIVKNINYTKQHSVCNNNLNK